MKKVLCPKCLGTGSPVNHVLIGRERRAERERRDLGLWEVARAMGITPSHLCYLEQGKRSWNPELLSAHQKACRN